jgi:hypothetical protein
VVETFQFANSNPSLRARPFSRFSPAYQCSKRRIPVKTMGNGDDFGIFDGAAGLDYGGGTGFGGFFDAVGEGATTLPVSGDWDFITASLTESTRLIWPAFIERSFRAVQRQASQGSSKGADGGNERKL